MLLHRSAAGLALLGLALLVASPAVAQIEDRQDNLPDPIPPPIPKETPPKDVPKYKGIIEEVPEEEWGLEADLIAALQNTASVYEEYARRFVCDEEARLAEYDDSEQVSKEKIRNYGYLLLRGSVGDPVREFRQNIGKDGNPKGAVDDSEPFPPAYMWVFLFSEFYEPYFTFRVAETRFHGFDLVHEIHFRGSLPFTDGKDIRQWEGRVLIDAFYFTPLELEAEPIGQKSRLDGLYRLWSQSFNLLGFRTGKKPLGYNARLEFGLKKGDLRLPTSLRYDTRRAVGPEQLVIVEASTRSYSRYMFTDVTTEDPRIGGVVPPPPPPAVGGSNPDRPEARLTQAPGDGELGGMDGAREPQAGSGVRKEETGRETAERLEAIRRGDPDAFEAVAREHAPGLFRVALRLTGRREDAEDLVQETLVRALPRLTRFEGRASLSTYLFRALGNLWKNRLRSKSRSPLVSWFRGRSRDEDDESTALDPADPGPSAVERMEAADRAEDVRQAVSELEPTRRLTLLLREVEEMSYEEISGVTGVPIGTVRSRLARARDDLRGLLTRRS